VPNSCYSIARRMSVAYMTNYVVCVETATIKSDSFTMHLVKMVKGPVMDH